MSEHEAPGQVCRCNLPGWMPGVEHVPVTWERPTWVTSREGRMRPVVIVDHVMQGWLTTMRNYALQRGTELRKVTPHFNIARTGWTLQIESVFTPGIHATALQVPTAVRVLQRAQLNYGASLYSVGIEHEGFSVPVFAPARMTPALWAATWGSDNPWPAPMVAASIRAKKWLFEQIPELGAPSRDSIIGHSEIDARNRPDDPQARDHEDVWPRDHMIAELTRLLQPALTPEQQEAVDYLRTPAGRALPEPEQRRILALVGLSAMPGGAPTAPTPAQPAPAQPDARLVAAQAAIASARNELNTARYEVRTALDRLQHLEAAKRAIDAAEAALGRVA